MSDDEDKAERRRLKRRIRRWFPDGGVVTVPGSALQWIVDHEPKGMSPDETAAWMQARLMEFVQSAERFDALAGEADEDKVN